jgi:hypothetical protein
VLTVNAQLDIISYFTLTLVNTQLDIVSYFATRQRSVRYCFLLYHSLTLS